MSVRNRFLVLCCAVLVLAGVAVASVLHASARAERRGQVQAGGPSVTSGAVSLASPGRMVFRNMAWGPRIDAALSSATPTFFAVGTLHLVGPDNVQTFLRDDVRRVD